MIVGALLLACMAACSPAAAAAPPAPAPVERVLYELVVERPGSRSQGVRGVLYDEAGREREPKGPDEVIHTGFGDFRYVGCAYLWSTCGYLRDGGGFAGPGAGNDPTLSGVTRYRVTILSSAEDIAFRGDLLNGEAMIVAEQASLETPLGVFTQTDGVFAGLRWSGWLPEAWAQSAQR